MEQSEPPNEGVTSQFFRHHRLSPSHMNSPYRALNGLENPYAYLTPYVNLTNVRKNALYDDFFPARR